MLGAGFQLHQVDDVDDTNLQFWHGVTQDRDGGQRFQRWGVAAAGHDDVRFFPGITGSTIPDADALGAVLDRLFHRQPLRARIASVRPALASRW